MPDSYQPHGRRGIIGAKPSRAAAGLPEQGFVFCCFNQAYKITPEIFDVWCRLLLSIPDSVLWLLKSPRAEDNLRRGSVSSRHRRGAHRLRHRSVAEAIIWGVCNWPTWSSDTAPYNAHTTASDALWAGVPIGHLRRGYVSFAGCGQRAECDRPAGTGDHRSRSIFRAGPGAGKRCLQVARLKEKLAANRMSSALFGIQGYTRHLEALYDTMWRKYLHGESPGLISAI